MDTSGSVYVRDTALVAYPLLGNHICKRRRPKAKEFESLSVLARLKYEPQQKTVVLQLVHGEDSLKGVFEQIAKAFKLPAQQRRARKPKKRQGPGGKKKPPSPEAAPEQVEPWETIIGLQLEGTVLTPYMPFPGKAATCGQVGGWKPPEVKGGDERPFERPFVVKSCKELRHGDKLVVLVGDCTMTLSKKELQQQAQEVQKSDGICVELHQHRCEDCERFGAPSAKILLPFQRKKRQVVVTATVAEGTAGSMMMRRLQVAGAPTSLAWVLDGTYLTDPSRPLINGHPHYTRLLPLAADTALRKHQSLNGYTLEPLTVHCFAIKDRGLNAARAQATAVSAAGGASVGMRVRAETTWVIALASSAEAAALGSDVDAASDALAVAEELAIATASGAKRAINRLASAQKKLQHILAGLKVGLDGGTGGTRVAGSGDLSTAEALSGDFLDSLDETELRPLATLVLGKQERRTALSSFNETELRQCLKKAGEDMSSESAEHLAAEDSKALAALAEAEGGVRLAADLAGRAKCHRQQCELALRVRRVEESEAKAREKASLAAGTQPEGAGHARGQRQQPYPIPVLAYLHQPPGAHPIDWARKTKRAPVDCGRWSAAVDSQWEHGIPLEVRSTDLRLTTVWPPWSDNTAAGTAARTAALAVGTGGVEAATEAATEAARIDRDWRRALRLVLEAMHLPQTEYHGIEIAAVHQLANRSEGAPLACDVSPSQFSMDGTSSAPFGSSTGTRRTITATRVGKSTATSPEFTIGKPLAPPSPEAAHYAGTNARWLAPSARIVWQKEQAGGRIDAGGEDEVEVVAVQQLLEEDTGGNEFSAELHLRLCRRQVPHAITRGAALEHGIHLYKAPQLAAEDEMELIKGLEKLELCPFRHKRCMTKLQEEAQAEAPAEAEAEEQADAEEQAKSAARPPAPEPAPASAAPAAAPVSEEQVTAAAASAAAAIAAIAQARAWVTVQAVVMEVEMLSSLRRMEDMERHYERAHGERSLPIPLIIPLPFPSRFPDAPAADSTGTSAVLLAGTMPCIVSVLLDPSSKAAAAATHHTSRVDISGVYSGDDPSAAWSGDSYARSLVTADGEGRASKDTSSTDTSSTAAPIAASATAYSRRYRILESRIRDSLGLHSSAVLELRTHDGSVVPRALPPRTATRLDIIPRHKGRGKTGPWESLAPETQLGLLDGDEIRVRVVDEDEESEESEGEEVLFEESSEGTHHSDNHDGTDGRACNQPQPLYGGLEGHRREMVLRKLLGWRCYPLLKLHTDPRLCAARQAIRQLQLLHGWRICSQPEPHPGIGAGGGIGRGAAVWGYDVLRCGDGGRVELLDNDGSAIHPMVTGTSHQYDRKGRGDTAADVIARKVAQTVRYLERGVRTDAVHGAVHGAVKHSSDADVTTLWTGGDARVPHRGEHMHHLQRERAAATAEYEAVLMEQCIQWRKAEKALGETSKLKGTVLGGGAAVIAAGTAGAATVCGQIIGKKHSSSSSSRGRGSVSVGAKKHHPLDQHTLHFQRATQLGLKFVRIRRTQKLRKAGGTSGERLISRARVAVGVNNAAFLLRLGAACTEFPRLVTVVGVRCEFFAEMRNLDQVLLALRDPSNSHVLRHLAHQRIGPVDGDEWLRAPRKQR
jgi:hypothetical protein